MGVIASVLQVRPGEVRPVALLFALSFCCGAATVTFESAAGAQFLSDFSADQLSWVYILSAGVTSLIGWIYIRLERRLELATLLRGTMSALLVSVIAFWLLLQAHVGQWLSFTLFLWFDVLTMLANLATWGLTLEVLTVRQGKRLFGPINAGEQLAGMSFGLAMGVLVAIFNPENLLLISALALSVALGVLGTFLDQYGRGFSAPEDDEDGGADDNLIDENTSGRTFMQLLRDPLLSRIFLLSALTVVGFYSLEYLTYHQVGERFKGDEAATASFLGAVTGVAQLFTLLGAWFLSGRLLERFGVRVALVLLPAVLGLAAMVAIGVGYWAGVGPWFFWIIVGARVLDTFLRGVVEDETMLVLYQPLEPGQRIVAQARSEGVVEPLSALVAGGFQLAVVAVSDDPRVFLIALIVPFVMWIWVSWDTGRAYGTALVGAIDRRVLTGRNLRLADASTLSIFQERLSSPHPGEVIFCLDTLERIEHPTYNAILRGLLDHGSAVVRREVLVRLERRRPPDAFRALLLRADTEPDPEVRAMAVRVLCAIGGPEAHSAVLGRLDSEEPEVRQAVLLGLLRSGELGAVLVAADRISRLTVSRAVEDRVVAAEIIGDVASPTAHSLLNELLRDRDMTVCRAALVAAGRVRHPALWPSLILHLGQPGLRASAAEALAHIGPPVLRRLDEAFCEPGQERPLRVRIAHLFGRIPSRESIQFLRLHLAERDAQVRAQVFQSLSACGFRATPSEVSQLSRVLEEEVRGFTRILATLRDFPDEPRYMYLRGALREEMNQGRRRIFWVLSFLYEPKNMLLARDSLEHPSAQRRAWAVEVVDLQLSTDLKPMILPLLEDHEDDERLSHLSGRFPQPRQDRISRLRELISRDDSTSSLWTRLCAVQASVMLEARSLWDTIEPLLANREPALRETGLWALASLDPRRAREPVRALRADPNEGVAELAAYVLSDMTSEAPMLLTVEKVIILKSVSIFSRTPEEVLVDVASVLKEVDIKKGETIFEKGDIGTSMYFIVHGKLKVHDGETIVAELGEREIVGELAVLDPQPRSASVTALEDTILLQLDQDALYELMTDRVEVARGIIRVLCHKLRNVILPKAEANGAAN